MTDLFLRFATEQGAYGSKSADFFPSMAAAKTLAALGALPRDLSGLERMVRARRSSKGGVGAQPGQPPDAWSTVYAIDALALTGAAIADWLPEFLLSLHDGGGFAMAPGQAPETWSTAFAMAGLARSGVPLPDPEASLRWLGAALLPSGGFTWSPAWVGRGRPDVRATAFVLRALEANDLLTAFWSTTDLQPTVDFLVAAQDPGGAFVLDDRHPPCLWGAGEGVDALRSLTGEPADVRACLDFVRSMRRGDGGYRRGPDYPDASDVWATMHAIQLELVLGDDLAPGERDETVAFVESCAVPGGGFTYRPPERASDILASSAAVIVGPARSSTVSFLESCRMPGEGGVAYMPGRGSEARSALWACTALHRRGRLGAEEGMARWAHAAQNPDGGFGPWEGRASNAVSTNAVLAALTVAGHSLASVIDTSAASGWIVQTLAACPVGHVDADLVDLSALVCAAQVLDVRVDNRSLRAALATHRRGLAWRRNRRAVPDVLATYVALTACQALGDLDRVVRDAASWIRQLPADASGVGWSDLATTGGGPLPTALASLILACADHGEPLPNLGL